MKTLHICFFLLIQFAILIIHPFTLNGQTVQDSIPDLQRDSILIAGNPDYRAGKIVNFLFGKNYREEWARPVNIKIFQFSKEGFKNPAPIQGTSGQELVAENSRGETFTFSLIEQAPAAVLSEKKTTGDEPTVLIDGISASYPYGELSIARMEEAIGVPYANPALVYLTDDPALGAYRKQFGNQIVIMKRIRYDPATLISTDSLLKLQYENPSIIINQRKLLRRRLFDLIIMDYNRGDEQWQWLKSPEQQELFIPVPVDRGQYFYINNGLFPKWLSSAMMFPELQGFRREAINISTFNSINIAFDKTFLNSLSEEDWIAEADSLKLLLTDELIRQAMGGQPTEIFEYSGEKIADILIDRRNRLTGEALTYYRYLSDAVEIYASNQTDSVNVDRKENGFVNVTVHAEGKPYFNRLFNPSETSELRIYGQESDDKFILTGNKGGMLIRLIGGPGEDSFIQEGSASQKLTHIYDLETEANTISGNPVKRHLSKKESVNHTDRGQIYFDRQGFAPRINLTFDDGIIPGISYRIIRNGFRKHPYRILHEFTADYAIGSKAVMIGYSMEAIELIGKNDLVLKFGTGLPGMVVNFVGYGNETRIDKKGRGYKYYRTRFNSAFSDLLVRRRFGKSSSFSLGPSFRYANVREKYNEDRIINLQSLEDIDLNHLFGDKYYVGPKALLNIDTRDNKIIPLSGIRLIADLAYYTGLNDISNSYGRYSLDLSGYINPQKIPGLVIALRIGMGATTGDAEYFQHQFLSGHYNLRGYRRFRFVGDQMVYTNVELRYHLLDFRSYLFPGALGFQVFHDMGRVWHKAENSNTWHHGPGAGLWIAPARRIVATGSLIFSKEGPIPYATIGFRF